MDWFRWHHGSVTDPKFQLVARKSGASLPDVLAVWAYMLESASQSTERGSFDIDAESLDCLFGFQDGKTEAILTAMGERRLVEENQISSWEKRQPKKEDDTANDRKRRQREREHESQITSVTPEQSRHVTPSHADVTLGHAREEESREEKINTEPTVLVGLASNPPGTVKPFRIPCPTEKLLDAFHDECPTLPRVMKLNDKRKTHLSARWREVDSDSKFSSVDDGVSVFRSIFAKVNASDFLAGRAKGWHATFDWIFESSSNFLKVCEGHYDNERRAAK
jgi:hypothetical protein